MNQSAKPSILPEHTQRIFNFLSPEACRKWLIKALHPQGPFCPGCGQALHGQRHIARFWRLEAVKCEACARQFNAFSDTQFTGTQMNPAQITALLFMLRFNRPDEEIAREIGADRRTVGRWRLRFAELGSNLAKPPKRANKHQSS